MEQRWMRYAKASLRRRCVCSDIRQSIRTQVNKSGTNLLHWAIWSGSIEAIEWVIARGTFAVDYHNYLGCSAAHWSATQGDVSLCQYFARKGVRFDERNKAGHTGVHKAAWYGKREAMQ